MKRSEFYGFRLPERGAREGEANDPADIEDLTYDLGLIDAELERQRVEDEDLEKKKATREELLQHTGSTANPHKVTKDQVGLGNVPDVSTNDQTPTYEAAAAPAELESGEKLSAAFGKLAAAVAALITHLADRVLHITAAERAAWNKVSEKLPLAGGTLTGFLTLHAAPTEALHAATKQYVDDAAAKAGSGDMSKSVYDADGDGVVDDAGKLGGHLPEYYAGAQAMAEALAGKAASSHTHTKSDVGLGNVDNTADSAKSVKYATSAGSATTAATANGLAQSVINSILLAAHPVGSLHLSVASTSPATLFGGTWVRITSAFLWALADGTAAGATGGSSTINLQHVHSTGNHALTVTEIPAHYHVALSYGSHEAGSDWVGAAGTAKARTQNVSNTGGGAAHNHGNTGNALSTAQSIMPPYYAVYCWRRTA